MSLLGLYAEFPHFLRNVYYAFTDFGFLHTAQTSPDAGEPQYLHIPISAELSEEMDDLRSSLNLIMPNFAPGLKLTGVVA